jgi:hypothetical protein
MKTYYANFEKATDFSFVLQKRFKATDFDHADFLASQICPNEALYSLYDISNYYSWQKDNVVNTKEGYRTQCTLYRKAFTKKELFKYFVREYAPQF